MEQCRQRRKNGKTNLHYLLYYCLTCRKASWMGWRWLNLLFTYNNLSQYQHWLVALSHTVPITTIWSTMQISWLEACKYRVDRLQLNARTSDLSVWVNYGLETINKEINVIFFKTKKFADRFTFSENDSI